MHTVWLKDAYTSKVILYLAVIYKEEAIQWISDKLNRCDILVIITGHVTPSVPQCCRDSVTWRSSKESDLCLIYVDIFTALMWSSMNLAWRLPRGETFGAGDNRQHDCSRKAGSRWAVQCNYCYNVFPPEKLYCDRKCRSKMSNWYWLKVCELRSWTQWRSVGVVWPAIQLSSFSNWPP